MAANDVWRLLTRGIYVSVTPNWPIDGDAACYAPTRRSSDGTEWDFVLPVNKQVSVRVKTMCRGPTEPLCFFWRGCRDTQDTAEPVFIETSDDVVWAKSNKFTLEFNKPCLLNNTMIFRDYEDEDLGNYSHEEDIDILSLKDERGKKIVCMSFHTAKWTGKAQPERVSGKAQRASVQRALSASALHGSARMASPALRASVVDRIDEFEMFMWSWFSGRPSEDEEQERQRLLRTVRTFFGEGDGGRAGYDACVLKLEHIRDALTALHGDVTEVFSTSREFSENFAREYTKNMKELNHIISIARLHALLMELEA